MAMGRMSLCLGRRGGDVMGTLDRTQAVRAEPVEILRALNKHCEMGLAALVGAKSTRRRSPGCLTRFA